MRTPILFLLFLLLLENSVYSQKWEDSTAVTADTSDWPLIRNNINDETFWITHAPTAEHYFNRGNYYLNIHQWQKAFDDFIIVIALSPSESVPFYKLNTSKEKIKDLKGTKTDSLLIKKYLPEYKWAWNKKGQIIIKLGKSEVAKKDFDKALEIKPHWTVPQFKLGLLYQTKKEFLKAISYYTMRLKSDSINYMVNNNIGLLYFKEKYYELAISYYSQAIKDFPKYFIAYRNRADAKIAKGSIDEACNDLKTASELGDKKSTKHYKKLCQNK